MSHKHHVLKYVATLPTGAQLQTTSWLWRTRWFVHSRHAHNHRDYKRCQPPDTNFHSRAAATPVGLWWHSPTFWTTLRDFGTKIYHPWVSEFSLRYPRSKPCRALLRWALCCGACNSSVYVRFEMIVWKRSVLGRLLGDFFRSGFVFRCSFL